MFVKAELYTERRGVFHVPILSMYVSFKAYDIIEDFKDLRLNLVKKVFKEVTSQWNKHFVIYPLSSCEDI